MSLFQILLPLILLTQPTLSLEGHTCAYSDNNYHPTAASECIYQASDNGICFYVTVNGNTYCQVSSNVKKEDTENNYSSQQTSLGATNIVGPKPSPIPNNCGLVGILEPISKENCTAITIPESHCCYVTINYSKDGESQSHVCRRVKKKPKKSDDVSEVKDSLDSLGASPSQIECKGYFWNVNFYALVFALSFVF